MKKRKFTQIIILVCSFALIICGCLGMYLNNNKVQKHMISNSQNRIEKNINLKSIKQTQRQNGNFNGQDTKDANVKTIIYNNLHAKGVNPIGLMSIPKVQMRNPILNGYGYRGSYLALGACTMKPDQTMGNGNYALAGHYMESNTIFHSLHKVTVGMNIYLTNLKKIYIYKVNRTTTINKYDVSVINNIPNKKIITLVTCIQLNKTPYRTLVQGNLIKTLPANQSNLKKYNL